MFDVCPSIVRYASSVSNVSFNTIFTCGDKMSLRRCFSVLYRLALLWFYTFGSQMFSCEDGYSSNEIRAASNLLNECATDYTNSAIFLFFLGRVERMKVHKLLIIKV